MPSGASLLLVAALDLSFWVDGHGITAVGVARVRHPPAFRASGVGPSAPARPGRGAPSMAVLTELCGLSALSVPFRAQTALQRRLGCLWCQLFRCGPSWGRQLLPIGGYFSVEHTET